MKGIQVQGAGKASLTELPHPQQKEGYAIIKVMAASICGTDVSTFRGTNVNVSSYPIVIGHETAGIVEEVGEENAFIFGLSSEEVIRFENYGGYDPMEIFNNDQDVRRVLMQLINGFYSRNDTELFRNLYDSLLNTNCTQYADTYFVLADFRAYAQAQERVMQAYKDEKRWAKSAILNVANVGKFSSDRTIEEYVRDIWHLRSVHVEMEEE